MISYFPQSYSSGCSHVQPTMRWLMKRWAIALAVILAGSAAEAVIITTYSDRGAFEDAASSLTTEDFESVSGDPHFNVNSVVVGDLTLSTDGDSTPNGNFNMVDTAPFRLPDGGSTASYDVNAPGDETLVNVVVFENNSDIFSISFAHPIVAFGADLGEFNNDGNLRTEISILGGSITGTGQAVATPVSSGREKIFFGLTSDTPFNQVAFTAVDSLDVFSIDNVSFAIPEPSSYAAILGFLGLGLALIRRKKRGA